MIGNDIGPRGTLLIVFANTVKSGESIPPCLVPHNTSKKSEKELHHFALYCIFMYQNMIIIKKQRGTFLSINFKKRLQCETVSKALLKYRKETKTLEPLLM